MILYVTINYLKMLVITKKDKRSPHDVVLGWTELLGWDDTIMLYSVRGCPGCPGHNHRQPGSGRYQDCVVQSCVTVYQSQSRGKRKHQQYHSRHHPVGPFLGKDKIKPLCSSP